MLTVTMDPQSNLDYGFDWTAAGWLAVGETISSFTVTVPTGVTLGTGGQAPAQSAGKVTYWLTGGTVGNKYDVVCHITTSAGRQDDRTIRHVVVNK